MLTLSDARIKPGDTADGSFAGSGPATWRYDGVIGGAHVVVQVWPYSQGRPWTHKHISIEQLIRLFDRTVELRRRTIPTTGVQEIVVFHGRNGVYAEQTRDSPFGTASRSTTHYSTPGGFFDAEAAGGLWWTRWM